MQPSGEVGLFEVANLPSPPADRRRSALQSCAVEWRAVLGWQDAGAGDDGMLPLPLLVADWTTIWHANSDAADCQLAARSSHAWEDARSIDARSLIVGYAGGAARRKKSKGSGSAGIKPVWNRK